MRALPSTDAPVPAFRKAGLLPELLADYLRDRIASGALPPGHRLVEQEVAGALQVSRVPLREAFRILCAEGLVTLSPHRGAEVSATSQEELEELFEVRSMIESRAAALAAERATPAQLQEMRQLVARMGAAIRSGDTVAYYQGAARFHDAVVEAAGNGSLARLHSQIKVKFRRYQMALSSVAEFPARSNQEHARLVKAIAERDPASAAGHAAEHVEALVQRYRRSRSAKSPAAARVRQP